MVHGNYNVFNFFVFFLLRGGGATHNYYKEKPLQALCTPTQAEIFTFVCTWIIKAFKKIFFRNVCTTVMLEPSHESFPVPRTILE
jgi:hypothetical protein